MHQSVFTRPQAPSPRCWSGWALALHVLLHLLGLLRGIARPAARHRQAGVRRLCQPCFVLRFRPAAGLRHRLWPGVEARGPLVGVTVRLALVNSVDLGSLTRYSIFCERNLRSTSLTDPEILALTVDEHTEFLPEESRRSAPQKPQTSLVVPRDSLNCADRRRRLREWSFKQRKACLSYWVSNTWPQWKCLTIVN